MDRQRRCCRCRHRCRYRIDDDDRRQSMTSDSIDSGRSTGIMSGRGNPSWTTIPAERADAIPASTERPTLLRRRRYPAVRLAIPSLSTDVTSSRLTTTRWRAFPGTIACVASRPCDGVNPRPPFPHSCPYPFLPLLPPRHLHHRLMFV